MTGELLRPRKSGIRLLYIVLSGVVTGFCITFPSWAGMILEWIAFVPASLALLSLAGDEKVKYRRIYGMGLLFFMSEYLVVYHWFFDFYPLDFTGMSRGYAAVVVGVAWIGLSLLAALAGGFVFVLFVLTARRPALKKNTLILPFAAGALWAVFEWSQTIGWTGVPWGRLALGQLAGNFTVGVLSSSLFGPYFITFLIVTVSFLVGGALYSGKIKLRALLATGLAAANLLCGAVIMCIPAGDTETVTVAAVQGNVSSRDKWDSTTYDSVIERYSAYTGQAAQAGAEIVVWPETTLPYKLIPGGERLTRLSALAVEYNVTIIVGCFDKSEQGNTRNVLTVINPDGSTGDVYAKRHLVPFGEYMPLRTLLTALIPPLAEIAMLDSDLEPGKDSSPLSVTGGITLGGLICFDSIYETLASDAARSGADIIALSTNDSWFSDSAAVYMHNEQARLRAVETGRPVIRAANTGISSSVDRFGRVNELLEPLVEGIIVTDVSYGGYASLYTLTGNLFVYLCIGFAAALLSPDTARDLMNRAGKREKHAPGT